MDVQLTEMKLRFFTNISHELRTPLTLILTPLESMVRKIDRWQQEDQEETHLTFISNQLMMIQRNAQRLLSLVNNLLDFRKLEMGQQKLELTNGDIFEFVRTVCETFRPISTEKGIGLGYAIPNEQLYINFDSRKLQHILYNLLSNAFKFTPAGGQIAVSIAKTDTEWLSITVKDTGCGIPSRDLPHIFDRYYQSKNTADPSVTGTGIGLHLTKEYLQLHGGNITVNSKLGEGTTFTAFLPTNIKMKEQPLPAEPHQQAE
jgi:signal transduction histidine kinase